MAQWSYQRRNKRTGRTASIDHNNHATSALPPLMGPGNGNDAEHEEEGGLLVLDPDTKTKRPSFYKVILLNDDYTPMDFVVTVLETIFRKNHEESVEIMLTVHSKGAATVGIYTRDVAETKTDQVIEYARLNDYPLQCVIEKDE